MAVQPYSATAPIKALSGSQTVPGITFTGGDTDTGIYSPADNQVGITTGGTSKLIIDENGSLQVVRGTKDNPAIYFDGGTGIYSPGADQVVISTNGTGRLFVASDGTVGLGTASPFSDATVTISSPASPIIALERSTSNLLDAAIGMGGNSDITFWGGGDPDARLVSDLDKLMVITSNGNVGIGTTSVSAKLHVEDDGTGNTSPGNAQLIRIESTGAGTDAALRFKSGTSLYSQIGAIGADLYAYTSNNERLRITSDGKVGLGTSSPDAALDIRPGDSSASSIGGRSINYGANLVSNSGRTGFLVRVNNNFTSASDNAGFMWLYPFDTGGNASNKVFRSATGATLVDKFWVDQGGSGYFANKLGLGTTSPSKELHIQPAADNGGILVKSAFANRFAAFTSTTTNAGYRFGYSESTGGLIQRCDEDGAFVANVMALDSSGNVGIGVTSPSTKLTIGDSSNSELRVLRNNNIFSDFYASMRTNGLDVVLDGAKTRTYTINIDPENATANSAFSVNIDNSERARIDDSGRLLVGTSSTSGQNSLLQVVGDECAQFHKGTNDTAPSTLNFSKSRNTAYGSFTIVQDGDRLGSIAFRGDDGTDYLTRAAEIVCEVDGTPGANDMPGRLTFSTTADGSASPTERMRITSDAYVRLASGTGGIQFNGDTAAANALDDYEEGTWTPVIAGGTTAGTGTYSTQVGRYTKVGKQIHCAGTLIWTAHDGTGNMRIEGLPFAALNISDLFNAAVFAYVANITMPADSILMGDLANNTSRMNLRSVVTGGGTPSTLAMDSTGNIYFSITYQTN